VQIFSRDSWSWHESGVLRDPFIRLQSWGANLQTDTVNLESDFRGLTRKLRDDVEERYLAHKSLTKKVTYTTSDPFVEQTRASHPLGRIGRSTRIGGRNPSDPQDNLEKPFYNNIQTRILEGRVRESSREGFLGIELLIVILFSYILLDLYKEQITVRFILYVIKNKQLDQFFLYIYC
jgi:hypothetical protein